MVSQCIAGIRISTGEATSSRRKRNVFDGRLLMRTCTNLSNHLNSYSAVERVPFERVLKVAITEPMYVCMPGVCLRCEHKLLAF